MSYIPLPISTISDAQNLLVYNNDSANYGISTVLLNSTGTTVPTQFWYPSSIPTASQYQIYFSTGLANPTNFRLWANGANYGTATPVLPSTVSLYLGTLLGSTDSNATWETYYLNDNPSTPYGFVYENAIGSGNFSNISSYSLLYSYNDLGTNDVSTFAVRLYNLRLTGYLPPPPPPPPAPTVPSVVIQSCGCGPKSSGPGAILESMHLEKRVQNCTVFTSAMAQALVKSQLRGVPSSVRTQKVQQDTLDCYAPITDPSRRFALYQGPVISPPCPPTPAEQLNSTRPKVSQGGDCLQQVPFYQRPSK